MYRNLLIVERNGGISGGAMVHAAAPAACGSIRRQRQGKRRDEAPRKHTEK